MDGVERGAVRGRAVQARPDERLLRVPPIEDLSDEARDDLLGCYALLLEIGRRRGLLGGEADDGAEAI